MAPERKKTVAGLAGDAEAFPILKQWDFFNHAGVAALPRCAGDALRRHADEAERDAYIGTGWYRDIEVLRGLAAQLVHAAPEEIALVKNTSEGLATAARGIDWRPGDRIVTTAVEYPANIYPWMDVANQRGVELVMVQEEEGADFARRVPMERILEKAKHPRTRLVTLSHVEFASGFRHDVAAIGNWCREHGKLFCVDGIQTAGALKVDVRAMGIDFLAADGHKWMLGPEGAGIFYCRRELQNSVRPLVVGWANVINAEEYGSYDFTLRDDARRYECGSHSLATFLALKASLEMILEVGVEAISSRLWELGAHLVARLRAKGYRVISPRGPDEWSGIVSFASAVHDHKKIFTALRREKTEIALREGRLRASPHFYNTVEQMDRLAERLPGH